MLVRLGKEEVLEGIADGDLVLIPYLDAYGVAVVRSNR